VLPNSVLAAFDNWGKPSENNVILVILTHVASVDGDSLFLPFMWKVGKFVEKWSLLRAFKNCGPIYGKLCVEWFNLRETWCLAWHAQMFLYLLKTLFWLSLATARQFDEIFVFASFGK